MNKYRWSLALAAVVVLVFALLLVARRPDPLPNPNGYDDFVAARQLILGEVIGGRVILKQRDKVLMAGFAASNEPVLARVRLGLSREVRMPVTMDSQGWNTIVLNQFAVGAVGSAISLIAQQRAGEGHVDEAATINLDCIRLAIAGAQGGVEFNYWIQEQGELVALARLWQLAPQLDAARVRDTVQTLAATEAMREPRAIVRRRHIRLLFGLDGWWRTWAGLKDMTAKIVGRNDPLELVLFFDRQILQARRELSLDLARRAFTLERGRPPTSDAELVPEYLPALPPVAPPQ